MQHPLEDPSLTPFGFVLVWKDRLKPLGEDMINGDREISKLWTAANRLSVKAPRPAESIIHKILPGVATGQPVEQYDFEFDGKAYLSRDIAVLSSFVQWLGTNCGGAFVRSTNLDPRLIVRRFDKYQERECIIEHVLLGWPTKGLNKNTKDEISKRDRDLIRALMIWLDQSDGRAFVAQFEARLRRLDEDRMAAFRRRHQAAA